MLMTLHNPNEHRTQTESSEHFQMNPKLNKMVYQLTPSVIIIKFTFCFDFCSAKRGLLFYIHLQDLVLAIWAYVAYYIKHG